MKKQGKRKKGRMEEVEEVNEDTSNVCGKIINKKMQIKKEHTRKRKKCKRNLRSIYNGL